MWSDRETYRRLRSSYFYWVSFMKEIPWKKLCDCYPIEENTADSIVYCCWNKLCHHCQIRWTYMKGNLCKPLCKKRAHRKHIIAFMLLIPCFFIEGKSCDYSDVFTFFDLSVICETNVMWLSYSLLFFCFLIEGKSCEYFLL